MKPFKIIKYFLVIKIATYLFIAFSLIHASQHTHIVIIPKGTSTYEVAKLFKEKEIITNEYAFYGIAYLFAKVGNKYIQPGEYEFQKGTSIIGVFKKVWHGDRIIRKVTIPEGYSIQQVFELIDNAEGLEGSLEKTNIKEGELLPETYFYNWGDTKNSIIMRMDTAMKQFLDHITQETTNLPMPKEQILTLASIIEEETSISEEKPMVAAVYLNRLKIGMPLQADPTVIYAITDGKYNLDRVLNYQDLKYNSPYNTYTNKGLPPGPISCPGKESIQAVLKPSITNALYFVADGKGGHNFAQSLKEHNINVSRYRLASLPKAN